jgi:hypothetical protein
MKHAAISIIAIAFVAALNAAPAQALITRTFLSANGSDANTCARTAPCRTLQEAHNKTSAGGEINMLDPAGYGTVTITKAISIVNDGVGSAGVLVPAGVDGITINAGVNDVVNLRGLIVEGAGVGSSGIVLLSAKSLTIQNCVIRNLLNHGIAIVPTTTSTIAVSDTYVANNGALGIVVQPTGSGGVKAVFNRVEVYNSGDHGIGVFGNLATGFVWATVVDSVSAHNAVSGFFVFKDTNALGTYLIIARSTATFNADRGVMASGAGARFRISQSTMTFNSFGPWAVADGGIDYSYGDNYLDGEPGPTIIPKG